MAIVSNKKNGTVVLHFAANATLTIAGNSTVSNVATGNEILTGANIKQVWFGSPGHWVVKRGANVVGVYNNSGHVNYAAYATSLNVDNTGTLVLELNGSANGYIMVELQKLGTLPSNY